jgi:hypothetical protein
MRGKQKRNRREQMHADVRSNLIILSNQRDILSNIYMKSSIPLCEGTVKKNI